MVNSDEKPGCQIKARTREQPRTPLLSLTQGRSPAGPLSNPPSDVPRLLVKGGQPEPGSVSWANLGEATVLGSFHVNKPASVYLILTRMLGHFHDPL